MSADERRAERRARLIDAGLDVLGSEGIAGLTMTAVCAKAGLTERYFYESFKDRDALIVAIFDQVMAENDAAAVAAVDAAPADLYERCRAAVVTMMTILTEDPRKARAYIEAVGHPALKDRQDEMLKRSASQLALQMREHAGLGAKRYQEHLRLATTVLAGGLGQAILGWLDGSIKLSRDELIDHCAHLCVAAAESVRSNGRK